MLSVSYHGSSRQFARMFRVTHFFPMYYTVLEGGINSQFWADTTEHLPIGYREHKRIAHPKDWLPIDFGVQYLAHTDYLLTEAADDGDYTPHRKEWARAQDTIADMRLQPIECADRWCLYRTHEAAGPLGP
jgi:hypothetical protein